jgi:hypothetical protein
MAVLGNLVVPPPWAGGENTTAQAITQGFFVWQMSFFGKWGETGRITSNQASPTEGSVEV